MTSACLPLKRKYSPIAQPANGAIHLIGAASDVGDAAGAAHGLALLDELPLAEERDADVVLLEVERDPRHAMLELQQLQGDGVLEPVDTGDPVADLEHGA